MFTKPLITIVLASAVSMASAESLIQNSEFKNPIKPWKIFSLKETPATANSVAEGVLTIKAAGASEKPAGRQMVQQLQLDSNTKYKLEFEAKATLEGAKEVNVVIVHSKDPSKGSYGLWRKVELTPEWKTQTLQFTTKEILADDPPVLKFLMGTLKGDICFKNVKLAASAK